MLYDKNLEDSKANMLVMMMRNLKTKCHSPILIRSYYMPKRLLRDQINSKTFGVLSYIACSYLLSPATSVPSES